MEKIKLQDVYLPVDVRSIPELHFKVVSTNPRIENYIPAEKHSNMVVLTREQAIKMIEDAMEEERLNVSKGSWKEMREDRQFYLTQLFGEGK